MLAEFHPAIQVRPESGDLMFDVHVHNFSWDSSARARQAFDRVMDALAADEIVRHELVRGRLPVEA